MSLENELNNTLQKSKDRYLNTLKELVQIDTRVLGHGIEGGYELKGQKYLEKLLVKIGAKTEYVEIKEEQLKAALEKYNEGNLGHNYKDRPNLVGKFTGSGDGRSLILNGHMDTMPYGDKELWEHDPFLGEIIDGELYGLGSCDMKSGLVASLLAVDLIYSSGYQLKGDLIFESVVDEEGGGNGTLSLVQAGYKADAAVICEPTSLNLQIGHMGFIFYKIKVKGKSLHSSQKWKGVNAIKKAIKIIAGLEELEHDWLMKYRHPLMPSPTLNIGVIEGGDAGSTVPAECEFRFCLHYYPGLEKAQIEKEVEEAIANAVQGDSWLRENPVKVEKYQEGSSYQIDKNHQLVKTFAKQLAKDKKISASPSGNDARLLKNIGEIPTVVFGPGNFDDAHSIDEKVSVSQYLESILRYALFIADWCGIENS